MSLNQLLQDNIAVMQVALGDLVTDAVITHKLRGDFDPDTASTVQVQERHDVRATMPAKGDVLGSSQISGGAGVAFTVSDELKSLVFPPATVSGGDDLTINNETYRIHEVETVKPSTVDLLYILTLEQ